MKKRIILLGLILLYLGYGRAHPIESKFSAQFISALRDKIRESELLNESTVPQAVVEDKDIAYPGEEETLSVERSSCINLGNDGCVNGSIVGSGGDGGYLGGGGNPGK